MISSQIFYGVVEDRNDYLNLGRCKVRVAGMHTHDKTMLPTSDLPWASVIQHSGTFFVPQEGTQVVVQFFDYPTCQIPVVVGTLPSIPQHHTVFVNYYEGTAMIKTPLVPTGATLPQSAKQNSSHHSVDDSISSEANDNLFDQQIANATSGEQQLRLINGENIPTAVGFGNIAATQMQQIGSKVANSSEQRLKLEQSVGSTTKAASIVAQTESARRGSSVPVKLLTGETTISEQQSKFNENYEKMKVKYGAEKAATIAKQMIVEHQQAKVANNKGPQSVGRVAKAQTALQKFQQMNQQYVDRGFYDDKGNIKDVDVDQLKQHQQSLVKDFGDLGVDLSSNTPKDVVESIDGIVTQLVSDAAYGTVWESDEQKDSADNRLRNNISAMGSEMSSKFLERKQRADKKKENKIINLEGTLAGLVGNVDGLTNTIGNAADLITGGIAGGIGGAIGGVAGSLVGSLTNSPQIKAIINSFVGTLVSESVKKFIKKKLDSLFQWVFEKAMSMIGGMLEQILSAAGTIDTIVNAGYDILKNPGKALSTYCPTICSLLGFPPTITEKVKQIVDSMINGGCSFSDILQMIFGTETESGSGDKVADAIKDTLVTTIKSIFAAGVKPIEFVQKITNKIESVVNSAAVKVAILAVAIMTLNPSILNQYRLLTDLVRSINSKVESVISSINSVRGSLIQKMEQMVEDAIQGVMQSLNLGSMAQKIASFIPIGAIINFVINQFLSLMGIDGEPNIGISSEIAGSLASSNTLTSNVVKDVGSYSNFAKHGQNATSAMRGTAAEGGTPGVNGSYGGPNSSFATRVPQSIPTM